MPLLHLYQTLVARRYAYQTRADEVHRVRCADGVRVAVKRFRPAPGAPLRSTPVLCVPGLGADSHNYDAPAPFGLASYLQGLGFDTWAVDLRGTGMSLVHGKAWQAIDFDDHVELDLPAVVEHICAATGSAALSWVGHSMGGMLLYALLGTGRGARVRAGVTIAAPLGFPQRWAAAPILRPVRGLGEFIPGLHAGTLLRALAPFALRVRDPWNARFMELQNVDARSARRLMYHAVQDVPRELALQFRDWVHHDAFRSRDLAVDYRARLAGARTPVLCVVAPRDRLGTPVSVRRALDLLPNATAVTCGVQEGCSVDFGHIDILFGRAAPAEVFPRIADYLARHDVLQSPQARDAQQQGRRKQHLAVVQ